MKPMEGIYEVHPPMTREDMATMRKECKMGPATFNYSDPTPEMHADPLWEAIWNEIKPWDVNVPTEYAGYMGASGNHVTAIFLAIKPETDKLRGRIAELESAIAEVWAVASGEKQVAMDDTQGMEWITDYLSAIYGEQGS